MTCPLLQSIKAEKIIKGLEQLLYNEILRELELYSLGTKAQEGAALLFQMFGPQNTVGTKHLSLENG